MRHPARIVGFVPAVLGLLLLSGAPARAQIDDYDFAQGLADRGYFDLAEEVLNERIQSPGLSDTEISTAKLGLIAVQKRAADKETDPAEKLRKYRTSASGYEEFIDAHEDHPKFFDAIFQYGELLQNLGEALTRLMEDEQDPEKVKEYRQEGTDAIRDARMLLQRAADHLDTLPEDERDPNLYIKARFFRALNFYHEASLHPTGTFEKENSLKRAAEELEEFAWDYESTAAGLLALLYVGKAYGERALENEDRAEEFVDLAIDYLEGVIAQRERPGVLDNAYYAQNLLQRAVYEEARIYKWMKRYPDAVRTVERLDQLLEKPDGGKVEYGTFAYLAQRERFLALEQLGNLEAAIEICQQMAKETEGTPVGRKLARDLARLVDTAGSQLTVKIPTDVLFTTAEGFYSDRNYFRAIDFYQQVLAALREDGVTDDPRIPQAWSYIGKSYRKLKEYLAAAMAFEAGGKITGGGTLTSFDKNEEVIVENAFAAYTAYGQQIAIETQGAGDVMPLLRDRQKEMRDYLTRTYPDTDLVYYAGVEALDDEKYAEAIDLFGKVEKKSELLYPRAQAKLAQAHFERGKQAIEEAGGTVTREALDAFVAIDQIRQNFDLFVEDPNWRTADTSATKEREQARAAIRYYLARARQAQGKIEEAVAILDGYVEEFASHPSFVEAALYLEVDIRVDADQLAKAEEAVSRLNEKFPKSSITQAAYLQIGQAYKSRFSDALAAYARGKGVEDPDDVAEDYLAENDSARKQLVKSADLVKLWWDKRGRPFGKGLELGRDYFRLEEFGKALEVLEALYKRDRDNPKVSANSRLALKLLLAETYLWHRKYQEAVPLYEELYERFVGDRDDQVVNVELRRNFGMALGGTAILGPADQVIEYDGIEEYERAKDMWRPIAKSRNLKFTPDYWLAQFHMAYLDYKSGNEDAARKLVDNLTALYGDSLNEDATAPLFDWLRGKIR